MRQFFNNPSNPHASMILKRAFPRYLFKIKSYSKKVLPVDVDDFGEMMENKNFLYVDKTSMIKELIDDTSKVVVITRPRRWGKTLNMSMLQYFFSPTVLDKETKGMFDDLQISTIDDGKYLKEHQGKHPVIYMSLKDLTAANVPSLLRKYTFIIQEL
jgi:hypothetical protein